MDGQPSVLPRLGGTIRAPVSLLPSDASWEHLSTTHGTGVASEQRVRRDGYRGPNEARRKRRDAGGRCAPAGATGRRGCVRENLPAAQSPGLLIMLAYGWQYGGSRGPDSGSIPESGPLLPPYCQPYASIMSRPGDCAAGKFSRTQPRRPVAPAGAHRPPASLRFRLASFGPRYPSRRTLCSDATPVP